MRCEKIEMEQSEEMGMKVIEFWVRLSNVDVVQVEEKFVESGGW